MNDLTKDTLLDKYQQLLKISRDLASTLDLDVLLNKIVDAASELTGAEAASILLYDDLKRELYFQSATNLEQPMMRGLKVPVDNSIAGWIIRNREPVIIGDVREDDRHFQKIGITVEYSTSSLLGVPMVALDKNVGVLEAINKIDGSFSVEDQHILLALGVQAAAAIENTRLFQQSDLIADFVHELRTPLSSLSTAAHLLDHPKLSDVKKKEMLSVIQSETRRLLKMATSYLDLARMESGRSQLVFEDIDPRELIDDCIRIMQGEIEASALSMDINLNANLPTFRGDRDKIKQAIINLISNAIKYNSKGGEIGLSVVAKRGEITFLVSDTGQGIKKDYIANLFNKFYRVPGSDKFASGTGLGLSIVKRIVTSHGGTVAVTSNIGEGSTFSISFPYN